MSRTTWHLAALTTTAVTLLAAPAAAASFDTAVQSGSLSSTAATATKPGRPFIGTASAGVLGGTKTATARWSAPSNTGGSPITKYQVIAQRLNANNGVVASYKSIYKGPAARNLSMTLPSGRYQFKVMAWNSVGASPWSPASNYVTAR